MTSTSTGLEAEIVVERGAFRLDVSLRVREGETVALLGPNGAGKTTLLRVLAGLEPMTRGRVVVDGNVLDDTDDGRFVPPERRSVGLVFQDQALFPFLSARDNVAFGLRVRGVPRREAARRATEWLARLGLAERSSAKPRELSGGQAQRVALARALAPGPRLLLLDEPLAALDATVRVDVRRELQRQLHGFPGIRLLVTHDPVDAATLADRVAVIEDGRIVQDGAIDVVSAHPRSSYVADLVGVNLYRGTATAHHVALADGGHLIAADAPEGEVFAVVHPRAVVLHRHAPEGSARNVWAGTVEELDRLGDRVRVRVAGQPTIVAEVTPDAVDDLVLAASTPVWVSVKATDVTVYPA